MAWILMQPADDKESKKAAKKIVATGECNFYLEKNGKRILPVSYGSRLCTNMENKFHHFV